MKKAMRFVAVCTLVLAAATLSTSPAYAATRLVTICHVPPTPDITIAVSPIAVFFHLLHGDYLGPCVTPTPEPTEEPTATPVPTDEPTEEPTSEPTDEPTPTDEPAPTPTEEPTDEGPLPTGTPVVVQVAKEDRPVGVWMWLLWSPEGDTCALVDFGYDGSYSAPGVGRQLFWCGWTAVKAWGGPVTEDGWFDSSGHNLDNFYGYDRFSLEDLKDRYAP